ncbi:LOW QUALITY PROTEIN: hypothetical protein ACHAXT_013237 [Thalassiosira profunda]
MNDFLESALSRKPLRLVRQQAHLGDESRYTPVAILASGEHAGESSREGGPGTGLGAQDAGGAAGGGTGGEVAPRQAPLRHMSLFDLVAYGVGTTVGSGVRRRPFLRGPSQLDIVSDRGRRGIVEWMPYAELSAAFPLDGSTYSYAYITLGEVFAVISSLCQTLEYGVCAAAVARSWGNKFVDYVREGSSQNEGGNDLPAGFEKFIDPGYGINPMAAIIALLCTLLLLWGVRESKLATNIVSSTKVLLILFMIVAGFLLASGTLPNTEDVPASFSNWDPFVPPEFGAEGVVNGASILFFAYLGFDCICNLAGEAKNPVRDVPRAVLWTLTIDAAIYVLSALALTALLPYPEISPISGFPRAFGANGWVWAEKLTAIGEIIVLPLVVLTSIQAQTRLMFAMAKDKIAPKLFGRLAFSKISSPCCKKQGEDKIGNLTANVRFCGTVIVLLACFVPFRYMEDLISAGALLLFSLTDCCLLTIRYKCPSETFLGSMSSLDENASIFSGVTVRRELSLGRILLLLNLFPLISGLCFAFIPVAGVFLDGHRRFRTPFVPYLPALGIYSNWFMLANVGWQGLVMPVGYLFVGILLYGTFCTGKSVVNGACEFEDGSYRYRRNLLTDGRKSPTSGTSALQQALLEDQQWEDSNRRLKDGQGPNMKEELSEIEASKTAFV